MWTRAERKYDLSWPSEYAFSFGMSRETQNPGTEAVDELLNQELQDFAFMMRRKANN